MQMAMAVGELQRRGRRPAAPRDGLQARGGADRVAAGEALRRHGRERHRAARSPTRSTRRSRRSRTSASPRATRCSSGCSSTRARGSSCTTPRRSSRRCCAPSRWASTRPRPSPPTPGGTAWRCCGPTCMRPACRGRAGPVAARQRIRATMPRTDHGLDACTDRSSRPSGSSTAAPPTSRRRTAATARSRCDWASPASRSSARPSPSASSPSARRAGPTATWRDLCARRAHRRAARGARRRRGRSTASACTRREAIWLAGAAAAGSRGVPRRLARRRAAAAAPDAEPSYERSSPTCGPPASPPTITRCATTATGLDARGVITSSELRDAETGRRIEVAGLVTHRQRPATAAGITFLNLEDEPARQRDLPASGCGTATGASSARRRR